MAALIWLSSNGERLGSHHAVTPGYLIGRSKSCHLQIRRSSLSRWHARLRLDINGWKVEDLGSTNGTRVNGTQVTRRTTLRHADLLRVGDVVLRFWDKQPAPVPSDRGGGGGQPSAVAFVTEEDDN